MAWLHATPKKAEGDKSPEPEKSRLEQFKENGTEPELPPCDAQYLAGYLFEIGPSEAGNTITHGEIESWQRNIGIELAAWEVRTLRRLSTEYLRQAHEPYTCPAPYSNEVLIDQTRAVVANKFRAFISNSKVTRE